MKTGKFDVRGMTCSACVANVEKSVGKLDGVKAVQVSLLTNSMTVDFDEVVLSNEKISQAVEHAGYQAVSRDAALKNRQAKSDTDNSVIEQKEMKKRWWASFAFLVPLLYLSMGYMMEWPLPGVFSGRENAIVFALTLFLLTLPIVIVNKKYFVVGFRTLFHGAPNMDSLIAIGSSAAILYGVFALFGIGYAMGHNDAAKAMAFTHDLYFESGAAILTLITLGKYLEARSKSRTTDAITRLVNLTPKTAFVLKGGEETEIPAEEIVRGDVVVIRSGQMVPVDGVVLAGSGELDESALTGESIPVFRDQGQTVLSASINKSGYFTFEATRVGDDTTLAQMIRLVEDAASSKAPIARLADKISAIFVPMVIGIAVLSTLAWVFMGYPFGFALSVGIAVLVISCPCALGLATPVAIMVGTGKGAEYGILFKSAEAMETAHRVDTVVFDKTGTLTEGKPRVTDIITVDGVSEKELLEMAFSIEKPSEHSLAGAIVAEAEKRNLTAVPVSGFKTVLGKGIIAFIGNDKCIAGNIAFLRENNIGTEVVAETVDKLAMQGKTPLFIARNGAVAGVIAVADVLKANSASVVKELALMGKELIMLTGDHRATAAYVGSQCGITRTIAEVLPADKERVITGLQKEGKKVAMVGDGINDAPALARADVGIAIGSGTDVAIESADVVLMNGHLSGIVTLFQLSKAVIRNIKQNLFWAFFYNIIGIPLAAGAFYLSFGLKMNPMFAAAAMSFSSVTVVLNALRLLGFAPRMEMNRRIGSTVDTHYEVNAGHIKTNQQKKENTTMNKTLKIAGMSCGHCSARVEKALNAIDGVEANVHLETASASVTLTGDVTDDELKKAVDAAGYEVTDIQ